MRTHGTDWVHTLFQPIDDGSIAPQVMKSFWWLRRRRWPATPDGSGAGKTVDGAGLIIQPAAGTTSVKVAPPPAVCATVISPPCA